MPTAYRMSSLCFDELDKSEVFKDKNVWRDTLPGLRSRAYDDWDASELKSHCDCVQNLTRLDKSSGQVDLSDSGPLVFSRYTLLSRISCSKNYCGEQILPSAYFRYAAQQLPRYAIPRYEPIAANDVLVNQQPSTRWFSWVTQFYSTHPQQNTQPKFSCTIYVRRNCLDVNAARTTGICWHLIKYPVCNCDVFVWITQESSSKFCKIQPSISIV